MSGTTQIETTARKLDSGDYLIGLAGYTRTDGGELVESAIYETISDDRYPGGCLTFVVITLWHDDEMIEWRVDLNTPVTVLRYAEGAD